MRVGELMRFPGDLEQGDWMDSLGMPMRRGPEKEPPAKELRGFVRSGGSP